MRLLIFEWCCSGGLAGPDAGGMIDANDDVDALAREGRAMFHAIVADALRDGGFEVMALVDESLPIKLPPAVRRIVVPHGGEIETLVATARGADATVVVAPETAGVLAARVTSVRAVGGVVLAPSDPVIRLAADKQATIAALAAAGVPVPAGRALAAGEAWPECFRLPAVRKARESVGCVGLTVVRPGDPLPAASAGATRLEALAEGAPVGVSCVMGPGRIWPLAAMRQRFSPGPHPSYLGSDAVLEKLHQGRAALLAVRAIAALVRCDPRVTQAGWVGVDMILGARDDGLDDRVLEVNPRLTTSFVGLSSGRSGSLVRAIVAAAAGCEVKALDPSAITAFTLSHDMSAASPV